MAAISSDDDQTPIPRKNIQLDKQVGKDYETEPPHCSAQEENGRGEKTASSKAGRGLFWNS